MSLDIDAGEYIATKLEPDVLKMRGKSDENGLLPSAYIYNPLGEVEYDRSGNVTLEHGGLSLNFSYQKLTNRSLIELLKTLDDGPSNRYRKLTDFSLKDSEGHSLILTDLVPTDWNFVFYPDSSEIWGETHHKHKTVIINGNLNLPATILTALHEGGHVNERVGKTDETIANELERYNAIEKLDKSSPALEDIALHLQKERDAWAYADRKIRPFCRGSNTILTNDSVSAYVHLRLSLVTERIKSGMNRYHIEIPQRKAT